MDNLLMAVESILGYFYLLHYTQIYLSLNLEPCHELVGTLNV